MARLSSCPMRVFSAVPKAGVRQDRKSGEKSPAASRRWCILESVMTRMVILVSLLACISIPVVAQESDSNVLVWQEGVLLQSNDFRGETGTARRPYQGAESRLTISLRFSCRNSVPNLDVHAEFDRSHSWAKPNMPPSLLEHEQVHFDIAELYARGTRKAFANVMNPCANPSAVEAISEHNNELSARAQENYDEETLHGTLPEAQATWTRTIRAMLAARGGSL